MPTENADCPGLQVVMSYAAFLLFDPGEATVALQTDSTNGLGWYDI